MLFRALLLGLVLPTASPAATRHEIDPEAWLEMRKMLREKGPRPSITEDVATLAGPDAALLRDGAPRRDQSREARLRLRSVALFGSIGPLGGPPLPKALVPFRSPALLLWLLASVLASTPASAAPPFVPPDPGTTGPWAVGHTSFEGFDADRGDRKLTVDLWYPADDAAVGEPTFYQLVDILGILILGITSDVALEDVPLAPFGFRPLVLFSHGSGGFNIQSIVLMETLASHGFIVAAPNHTGNSVFDEPGDTPFEDPATDRPKDISFLIDLLLARSSDPTDPLYLALNPFAIGVTGHSFGGFTAVAMAAGYGASAFGPVPPDPRVRAILPVSGSTDFFSDEELESIVIPTLFLGGTLDTAVPIDPNTTRPFALLRSKSLYRADVIGATHTHFANICDIAQVLIDAGIGPAAWPGIGAGALVEPYNDTCIPPAFSLAEANRIQNLYTVAFFRRHLLHDLRYAQFLRESYAAENEPDVDFFEGRRVTPRCGLGYELALVLAPLWLHQRRKPRRR